MALLEKAAGQGHAHAMQALGCFHDARNDHEQAAAWFTKAAETGLPKAMFNLGLSIDKGEGVVAPDYLAAAGWYQRAADAGHGSAVGPGIHCSPCPPTLVEPSSLELNGAL